MKCLPFTSSVVLLSVSLPSSNWINLEAVFQHVHHKDETDHHCHSGDRDGRERFGHGLHGHPLCGADLTMTTRITATQTFTTVVQQRGTTDTSMETGHLCTPIVHRFTVSSLPSIVTLTFERHRLHPGMASTYTIDVQRYARFSD
jgi:hypothetical protein